MVFLRGSSGACSRVAGVGVWWWLGSRWFPQEKTVYGPPHGWPILVGISFCRGPQAAHFSRYNLFRGQPRAAHCSRCFLARNHGVARSVLRVLFCVFCFERSCFARCASRFMFCAVVFCAFVFYAFCFALSGSRFLVCFIDYII